MAGADVNVRNERGGRQFGYGLPPNVRLDFLVFDNAVLSMIDENVTLNVQ